MCSSLIEHKSFDGKLQFLAEIGLDNNQIAQLTGAKASTIAVRKSQLKKVKKK